MRKACVVCGGEFEATGRGTVGRTTCSAVCRQRQRQGYEKARTRVRPKRAPCVKQCILCSRDFETRFHGRTLYCSKGCAHQKILENKRRDHCKNRDRNNQRMREYSASQPRDARLTKSCAICAEKFEAVDWLGRNAPRMQTCSPACAITHKRGHSREYQQAHQEDSNERTRQWRLANLDKARESNRKSKLKNKDRAYAKQREWRLLNPDKVREKNHAGHVARQVKLRALKDLESKLAQLATPGVLP